ncbi:CDP-alcohol phosphatidyltransferase family protein [Sphaerotilus sp.]|uniref:CDP-alcohol phosphatidyltransferase family protein n=1 Tax=Sphaerotilus sp. TaxID=2093942 RepID=UPI002ACDBE4F|nr:CDP-alcohol phosphatidyltransferase family protein [Sphaerotilus sp.]MDZ7855664.1 CDP-alcohol phosphatidyltransferase family protein [Sphaerotilus sp.]
MLDRLMLAVLAPTVQRLASALVQRGATADAVTLAGAAVGLSGSALVALGHPLAGLVLMALGRLADGLDGAIARLTTPTARGAFLDITLDFLFYASVPLAFAVLDPGRNALAAAVLLAAFIGTGSSFLAFAILAERQGLDSAAYPQKGFYYLGGLTEGTETLLCFAAMCLWPAAFAPLAFGFAALCGLTLLTRLSAGWTLLQAAPDKDTTP